MSPPVRRPLVRVDADAQEQALERIGVAGRDGDVREVAVAHDRVFRQAERLVRLGIVHARLDRGQHVLFAPLSRLNDHRDIGTRRHVHERELARGIGDRRRHERRVQTSAPVARRSGWKCGQLGVVRDKHRDVVEWVLKGGVVYRSADGRVDAGSAMGSSGSASAATSDASVSSCPPNPPFATLPLAALLRLEPPAPEVLPPAPLAALPTTLPLSVGAKGLPNPEDSLGAHPAASGRRTAAHGDARASRGMGETSTFAFARRAFEELEETVSPPGAMYDAASGRATTSPLKDARDGEPHVPEIVDCALGLIRVGRQRREGVHPPLVVADHANLPSTRDGVGTADGGVEPEGGRVVKAKSDVARTEGGAKTGLSKKGRGADGHANVETGTHRLIADRGQRTGARVTEGEGLGHVADGDAEHRPGIVARMNADANAAVVGAPRRRGGWLSTVDLRNSVVE